MFDRAGWDADLDDTQLAAATHGDAPLVIMAGAGTGKTRTLTARVASLIDRGVPPERILLLTFTRRAADDMIARAAALCTRPEAGRRIQGGTFHAVAHGIVTRHTAALGLPDAISVLDRGDAADAIDLIRQELKDGTPEPEKRAAARTRQPTAATLIDIYSRAVNTGRPARELVATRVPVGRATHRPRSGGIPRVHRPQAVSGTAGLRRSASRVAEPARRPDAGSADRRAVGPRPGRRVPGREPHPGGHRSRAATRRTMSHRRGRRRAGDLRLPRRGQRAPRRADDRPPRRAGACARAELPLPPAASRPGQRGATRVSTDAALGPRRRVPTAARALPRRPGRGARGHRRGPRRCRRRASAARPGGPHAHRAPQRPARGRAHGAPGAVRQVRRAQVPGGRARQGLPRGAASPRQPGRRDRLVPSPAAARRHRSGARPRAADRAGCGRCSRPHRRACRGGRRGTGHGESRPGIDAFSSRVGARALSDRRPCAGVRRTAAPAAHRSLSRCRRHGFRISTG